MNPHHEFLGHASRQVSEVSGAVPSHGISNHESVSKEMGVELFRAVSWTLVTRILQACSRCKTLKQRCDQVSSCLTPCGNCLRKWISGKLNFRNEPCIRVDILNLCLHRKGSTDTPILEDWLSRKRARALALSSLLHSSEHAMHTRGRTIHLTQGIHGLTMKVRVSQYVMDTTDKTWYGWKDSRGQKQQMNMPLYYISDDISSITALFYQQFESDSAGNYLLSLLKEEPEIIRGAFCEAHRLSNKNSLLARALKLWCGTRFTELTWTICGDDKLDIIPPTEDENPWKDTVPVTPIMDTQLDDIAIKAFLQPHADRFLKQLERKMKEQDAADWYEVLLALIIILHNFERIFADVDHYTNRHGIKKLKSRNGASLSEQNDLACRSLISFFHYAYPGSMKFRSAMANNEDDHLLPETQQKFMQLLRRSFNETDKKDWRRRNVYQNPMFWVTQIMVSDWHGDFNHVVPLDNLTEQDFLTS
ncbi:hypothetical protein KJ359_002102 [Pestalotiopsis sp. 9143b]|nr:hypothetical protein KJ359_002102 [Pestalotiopsis sp. 9143b]